MTAAEAMGRVIHAFHPELKLPEDENTVRGIYLGALHGKRALLLMDNARDAAQVTPLMPPDTCCLIVTSRWHFTLPGLIAKDLEALPPDDARALLIKIAPRLKTPKVSETFGVWADEIASLCGYLPLALRLAGGALAERLDLNPADYARRLTDTQKRLELIEASIRLSYDLLTEELQKRWQALAVFPDDFDRAAAAAVWGMDEDGAQDALSELVRWSLLDFSATSDLTPQPPSLEGKGEQTPLPFRGGAGEEQTPLPFRGGAGGEVRYHLHDLTRLFADARLHETPEARAEAGKRHAAHYADVIGAANELYEQGGDSTMRGLAYSTRNEPTLRPGKRGRRQTQRQITTRRNCATATPMPEYIASTYACTLASGFAG